MSRRAVSPHGDGVSGHDLSVRLKAEFVVAHDQDEPRKSKHDRVFIPNEAIRRRICDETVRRELEKTIRLHSDGLGAVARKICDTHIRVFALLVLTGHVGSIPLILDRQTGFSDADLPLSLDSRQQDARALCRSESPETPLECFRGWSQNDVVSFGTMQFAVLAPILGEDKSSGIPEYVFDPRSILPFVRDGGKVHHSTQSKVSRIIIPASHHKFPIKNSQHGFAEKRFIPQGDFDPGLEERYRGELNRLRQIKAFNHPHLLTTLAALRQGDQYRLLFPLAQCDLLRHWETHPDPPEMSARYARWISAQLSGLAEGLKLVHHGSPAGSGRHGDITAENILVFANEDGDGPTLVLADWPGVKPSGGEVECTPQYRPPECDVRGEPISRASDVWCFGCVLLESATWILGGFSLFESFEDSRSSPYIYGPCFETLNFFELARYHGKEVQLIKPSVTEGIHRLHMHPSCTMFIHDVLELVRKDMLIVEGPARKRASIDQVHVQLLEMHKRCITDEDYCTKPAPWALELPTSTELEIVEVDLSDEIRSTMELFSAELREIRPQQGGPTVLRPGLDGPDKAV